MEHGTKKTACSSWNKEQNTEHFFGVVLGTITEIPVPGNIPMFPPVTIVTNNPEKVRTPANESRKTQN